MLSDEDKLIVRKSAIKSMKRYGASLDEIIQIMRESADYLESLKEKPDIIPEGELPED